MHFQNIMKWSEIYNNYKVSTETILNTDKITWKKKHIFNWAQIHVLHISKIHTIAYLLVALGDMPNAGKL